MGQMYGMSDGETPKTLVVNTANPIIMALKDCDEEKQKFVVKYVFSLAKLGFRQLTGEEFSEFVSCNLSLLDNFIK